MSHPPREERTRSGDSGFTKNLKWAASVVASIMILIGAVLSFDQRYAKADAVDKLRVEISDATAKVSASFDKIDAKMDTMVLGLQAVTSERTVRRQEIDRRLDRLERGR